MAGINKGYRYALLSAFLMGLAFTLGKVALTRLTPEFFVAWNFTFAAVPLGIWTVASGRLRDLLRCSAQDWLSIICFSLFSLAALYCMWTGVKHLDPTVAAFISRLQVLVAVVFGIAFLKERFGRWEAIGSLVLLGGLIVIRISFDVSLSYWFWVMIVGAVLFGTSEVIAKRAVRALHPVPLNFIRASTISVTFLVLVGCQGKPLFEFEGVWMYVVAVGIGGSLLARHFFLQAIRHIEISKAMLVRQMQPIFVFVLSFATLGMIPALQEGIGGILILTGAVIMIGGRGK